MNDFLKYALLGVGGYLVYEYLFGASSASPASAASVGSGSSIAPTGTVSTSVVSAPGTRSGGQVAAFASSGATMTSSQWNYYQNLDNPGGNIILGGPNVPGGNITYAQWMAAFNAPGTVVGPQPGGVSGLGHLINLNNLPSQPEIGWGVGDDEFDYGLGYLIMQGAKPGSMGHFRGLSGIVDAPENNAAYIDENVFNEAAATNGGLDSSSQDFYLAAGLPVAGLSS
jgi:hypothetical protein